MDHLTSKLLLFALIVLLSFQSCAEMKTWLSPKSSVKTSAPIKHTPQTSRSSVKTSASVTHTSPASSQAPAQAANLAKKHMDAGEFQKAIDIYSDEYQKQPQDLSLMKEYAKSLDRIKITADKALDKGDLAAAGRLYNILQNNFRKFNGVEQMISFNNAYLNTKLNYCKKTLSKQGFEEYRKGDLNKAVVLWQMLLAIDPNNKDIKEAVRTATQQQKNLQE
jgi:tetratricopeptide (TPR) repeat protein